MGDIKIGNSSITLKLGSADVSAAYLGSTLVYSGGTPPTPSNPKWIATYTGGTTSSAECDSTSAITQNEITLTNLVSVEIGYCVTSIGNYAFVQCGSLTSIDIPDSVTSIDAAAFIDCSGLTSINIPSGVTSIGGNAFRGCSGLTSITIEATTPPTLGIWGFNDTNNCPIYVPVESVDAYKNTGEWREYASRIQAIPSPAFQGKWLATYSDSHTESAECDSSSAITQNEITLTNLVSVEIGYCISEIRGDAFFNCDRLTSVTISDSVLYIGWQAFAYCTRLKSCTIGSGVVYIDGHAFEGCTELTSVTVNATTPPQLGNFPFDDTNNCPIYVPSGSVSAYQSAWSDYANRIQAIPNS